MKHMKKIVAAALTAAALTALLGAGSASATTLEIGGVKQTGVVTIVASLSAGTSAVLRDTFGFSQNTCTTSNMNGGTKVTSGATVTGPISTLSFSNCTNEPVVVHKAGTLHVANIAGTTGGTVTSSGAEVTTNSPFGTLTCLTGAGTHLGTLVAAAGSGHAALAVNATLQCSGISSKWVATYTVTSPTGLGVIA